MNRVKTLVILSPGFPASEADSICVPPQQIFVRNLKQNYPDLNIIVLALQYPFAGAKYDWHDIPVIAFGGRNKSKLFRLMNWMKVWRTLNKINKQCELIGLLSFWMSDCALIGNAFAKLKGLKHFCWILGQDAKPGNKYFNWVKPADNSLIALSDFIRKETLKNYKVEPVQVIPPGIDVSLFNVSSVTRDINILGAGYLIPLKQYAVLISLVYSLKASHPNIKAVICGDGPERKSLQNLINLLGLKDNIELAGELPHTAVLALMNRTKIFIHPSAYEGFGVVCLEALYAGAQVVSFVKPMDADIRNWHIAKDQGDMLDMVKNLLENAEQNHDPVVSYLIGDSCEKMMRQFDYRDSATS